MGCTKTTITIRDVAQKAGVSVSTVSRVLNDMPDVEFPFAIEVMKGVNRAITQPWLRVDRLPRGYDLADLTYGPLDCRGQDRSSFLLFCPRIEAATTADWEWNGFLLI